MPEDDSKCTSGKRLWNSSSTRKVVNSDTLLELVGMPHALSVIVCLPDSALDFAGSAAKTSDKKVVIRIEKLLNINTSSLHCIDSIRISELQQPQSVVPGNLAEDFLGDLLLLTQVRQKTGQFWRNVRITDVHAEK